MRRLALTAVMAFILLAPTAQASAPIAHSSAVCADYSNQAAAQRAGDTRDTDGDGVYCESLPCPCARPGSPAPRSNPKPRPRPKPKRKPKPRAQVLTGRITDVVDGDTIKVSVTGAKRDNYTVRLLGIDTPETYGGVECGGREASSSMWAMSFSAPQDSDSDGLVDSAGGEGRRVKLTTDPTQARFDRYGRLLAYARTFDGSDLNYEQVALGWSKAYVYGGKPFKRTAEFRSVAREAAAAGDGAWSICEGDFHRPL